MAAECMALASAVKEARWLSMMYEELGLNECMELLISVFCDSQAAIKFASNRVDRSRTRHIDIAHHVAREAVQSGITTLTHVHSNENVADILTKGLRSAAQQNALKLFNMKSQEIGRE
ncbi:hypothetical protein M514_00879 [Trichuris suis]|uniref:RNase H type-1 domain-containing protein n=1 Tax=Trichuris suis TaxID=68888 RepID=A0A085MYX2_9BILA|nr:hypothetical protein M513_00879 [Trichuris suis]KFD62418.1 hypothetical protein M514_00879 [Trichuris suis]KHJ47548.1 hypothetical protein D918_02408 [Trichuris suis]